MFAFLDIGSYLSLVRLMFICSSTGLCLSLSRFVSICPSYCWCFSYLSVDSYDRFMFVCLYNIHLVFLDRVVCLGRSESLGRFVSHVSCVCLSTGSCRTCQSLDWFVSVSWAFRVCLYVGFCLSLGRSVSVSWPFHVSLSLDRFVSVSQPVRV